jgi:hypothetical protein
MVSLYVPRIAYTARVTPLASARPAAEATSNSAHFITACIFCFQGEAEDNPKRRRCNPTAGSYAPGVHGHIAQKS